jgi:hypothetical protein
MFWEFELPAATRTDKGGAVRGTAGSRSAQHAGRLAASPRDSVRADPTGSAAAQPPARADASDAEGECDDAAARNVLQQPARFDGSMARSNAERPHQALAIRVPNDVYSRSPLVNRGLEELTYRFTTRPSSRLRIPSARKLPMCSE